MRPYWILISYFSWIELIKNLFNPLHAGLCERMCFRFLVGSRLSSRELSTAEPLTGMALLPSNDGVNFSPFSDAHGLLHAMSQLLFAVAAAAAAVIN